jgi:hypothetical protein
MVKCSRAFVIAFAFTFSVAPIGEGTERALQASDWPQWRGADRDGKIICIEWKTGRVVWGGDKRGPGEGSAAITDADGRLYFRYKDGTVALLSASPDGYKLHGSFKIPGVTPPSWPPPVIADGKLYLREQDALYCYKIR